MVVTMLATGAGQTPPGTPDQISRKVRHRGSDDPNIKPSPEINVRAGKSEVIAPITKTPSGRVLCSITFDNFTDLITKTYIDGRYAGTIRPFGELSASVATGTTVLYARAEYDDGSADAWGPIRVNCQTKYLWRLAE